MSGKYVTNGKDFKGFFQNSPIFYHLKVKVILYQKVTQLA